jgi:hypothetical protein
MSIIVELIHAILMIAWILSIPFLFLKRWKKLTIISVIYNISFITVNRISHWILGECILTRAARWAGGEWNNEWFTIKIIRIIFGFIPTNKNIIYIEQTLLFTVSIGILFSLFIKKFPIKN